MRIGSFGKVVSPLSCRYFVHSLETLFYRLVLLVEFDCCEWWIVWILGDWIVVGLSEGLALSLTTSSSIVSSALGPLAASLSLVASSSSASWLPWGVLILPCDVLRVVWGAAVRDGFACYVLQWPHLNGVVRH